MLVLTRKSGQKIIIGENSSIEVVILGVKGSQVKIGISAPKEVPVYREEISILIKKSKREIDRDEA